ncbi:AsmA family protein [Methylobacillus gramineus]|uniref:AsmA family protein n=1 Tax=Methylobacillus gramineus TaxID=755169 RepID=UPI001CFFC383|nr:AsmA family protein [Methylobacillus gramineus]MCB5185918.1 AsmA family protein [Methylobacillus gramineus]
MNKLLKYSLFGLGGFVLVLVIIVVVFAATFNPNDYKPMIVKLVKDKKQRTLNIEGDIKLAFWPKLGADLGKISLSEHNSDKEFAAVNGLKVSLALLPLLKKDLVVDTVYVDGARANIVRYKDGTTNFDDLLSQDEEEPSEQIKFDISGINVSNSAVSFRDEQAGSEYSINKFNLETGRVALATPFDLATDFQLITSQPRVNATVKLNGNFMADIEAKHFAASKLDAVIKGDIATINGADIRLTGDVDARPDNMELLVNSLKLAFSGNLDGAKLTADIAAPKLVVQKDTVSGEQAELAFSQERGMDILKAKLILADIKGSPRELQSSGINGEVSIKQAERSVESKFSSPFKGNLEQLVFELPKLVGKIDIKDKALPKGAARGDFVFKLLADVKQEKVNSEFSLDVEDTKLKGDVAVAGFAKPDIKFNLNGDKLDLNKLLGSKTAAKPVDKPVAKPAAKGNVSATDLSALKSLLLQGNVNIGSIIYEQYRLSGLKLGIKADGEQLNVSSFNVKLDETTIKGKFGISRFAKPIYHFDVDIDKVDADRYITDSEAKPAKKEEAAKPANPDAPIDLSALRQLNANGELRIGWLKLANVKSTNVRIKLKADSGVAELSPFSANLYEGSMNGALLVDARATPSIAIKQDMKGIAVGPLLVDAINNDMLNGKGSLSLDVTTKGDTVSALKQALNGKAALNLSNGAVKGIDIAGTLRGAKDKLNMLKGKSSVEGDKSKQTDFSEMVASFNIKNGVAHNNDMSMKAPLFRITGSGNVDIANEKLDYLAKPTVVASLKGQGGADLQELNGLTVPVKLSGTFAKPAYAIDFAGLATALAQKKLLEGAGGAKGEAVKNLLEGNREDALKSLLNKKKPDEKAQDSSGESTAQPPAATPEEKAKKKLNKLLGL